MKTFILIMALLLTGCGTEYKCINGKQYVKFFYQDYWEPYGIYSCINDAEIGIKND